MNAPSCDLQGAPAPRSFAFGPWLLLPDRQLLLHGAAPVRIGCRPLDLLTALVERAGQLLSKRELMARVWPTTVVEECNLKVNMASLRRTLGDASGEARYIATVTGRGYRFVAPVQAGGLEQATPPLAPPERSQGLPMPITRVFGRSEAIERVRRDLLETRLVSIVGPGGIGKTTVALAVAEGLDEAAPGSVGLVELSSLDDASRVPEAIAEAAGLQLDASDPLADLCRQLRERELVLLVDNCEHLVDAVAQCIDRLLATSLRVRVLATSREPLTVPGERVRRLAGLDAAPAVALFVDRASCAFDAFRPADADTAAIAAICERLDGLALAIELAATRIEALGVAGILEQVGQRSRLLACRRAGPQRQRTMAASFAWSYGLLAPREAALLRAVSWLPGRFDLAAACAVSGLPCGEAAGALAQLVTKSLLMAEPGGERMAYRCPATTRSCGLEQLRAEGEEELVRRRHALHAGA